MLNMDEPPRMVRGPFLGPDGPLGDDIVLSSPFSPQSIVTFLDYEVDLSDNLSRLNLSQTSYNKTSFIYEYDSYPSGYSWLEIVLIASFITMCMVVIVVGNMLVIIAISTEKSLKSITNWFIASLTVSDLLLGLLIMPFSLAKLLMGYWIFGDLWCELYCAIDVLLTTASINNICLISLDRYWSITHAVAYLKQRTSTRSIVMIVSVWLFSGMVSIPPLLGWKKSNTTPQAYPLCEVSDDLGYVIYSSLGSFYIPSVIMIFVYIRIYYAAKARANKGLTKGKKKRFDAAGTPSDTGITFNAAPTPHVTTSPPVHMTLPNNGACVSYVDEKVQICETRIHNNGDSHSYELIPLKTVSAKVDAAGQLINNSYNEKNTTLTGLKPPTLIVRSRESGPPLLGPLSDHSGRVTPSGVSLGHFPEGDQISDMDPSSSDSGAVARCSSVMKPIRMKFCHPFVGRKINKSKREIIDVGKVTTSKSSSRDPDKEKRRIARKKEKRATLILGLIMGSFIGCWIPFFTLYILNPVVSFPESTFKVAFWLGYMNSAFNPVIYTIFNKDFRRAFRKILFK